MAVTSTGFITDAELKTLVATSLHKDEDSLNTVVWTTAIEFWNVGTYNQLLAYWLGKGYAAASIQNWTMGKLFQQNLALYSLLVKQNTKDDQMQTWKDELAYWRDLLKEQETLVADGAIASADDASESLFEIHVQGY